MGNWEDYLIESTNILKNKLNILDFDELKKKENDLVLNRLVELLLMPIEYKFDSAHLRFIHYFLFQDVYDFAGLYRTVVMYKEQSSFTSPDKIASELDELTNKMNNIEMNFDSKFQVAMYLAEYYYRLIQIHPFREGNGRSIREFIRQLAYQKFNYCLDYGKVNKDNFLRGVVEYKYYPTLLAYEINNAMEKEKINTK